MNFYLINKKPLFKKDENKTVWSHPFDGSKEMPIHWEREQDLKTGDIIFHYMKGEIIAISKIKREYWMKHLHILNLDKVGYDVGSIYYELQFPIKIKDILYLLEPTIAVESAVFVGKGLRPCNELLAVKLLEIVSERNLVEEVGFTMDLVTGKLEDRFAPLLKEAQTEARQKIEQDEQKFKEALFAISEEKCVLCEITLPSLLRATYVKPWKDCAVQERIDLDNGLLLCQNHSALYEQGYIMFDEMGKLHVSPRLDKQDYLKYGLDLAMRVKCSEGNKNYFQWHARYIFK